MNYEAHLLSVFADKETADDFFKSLMRQLNTITFNGAAKIDKNKRTLTAQSVTTSEYKSMPRASYWVSITKCNDVTLD